MTIRVYVDRKLLLERDPAKALAGPPIESIRDADLRHQSAAMAAGYNSLAEMAIDELIGLVRALEERVADLENQTMPSRFVESLP